MDKQNVIHTYHGILFGFKKKETMIHDTTWINLEFIMLCEISQLQKDKNCIFHLYEVPRIIKLIGTDSRRVVARNC